MEEWRQVNGFSGYEVSNLGRVRSVPREISNGRGVYTHPGKVMDPFVNEKGYRLVGLRRNGEYHRFLVHRLVCEQFVTGCKSRQVRHLDGNPANNAATNLAVGTNSDNQRDSVGHGTHHMARKTHCKNGHPFDEANTLHYVQAHGGPGRKCRKCHAERAHRSRHRLS